MEDIFYIFGTGLSINNISEEEWNYLKDKNTLGLGLFPLSHKQLKYYFSWDGYSVADWIINLLYDDGFTDSTLLLGSERTEQINKAKELGFEVNIVHKGMAMSFGGRGWFIDEPNPPVKYTYCRAHNFDQGLFRYRGSLSAGINAALILGAKEIRLVGVDLNNQSEFYYDKERWNKNDLHNEVVDKIYALHHQSMDEKKEANPGIAKFKNKLHTTAIPTTHPRFGNRMLRGMIDVVDWIDDELREEGHRGIYICSKESLLHKQNKLEYKNLM